MTKFVLLLLIMFGISSATICTWNGSWSPSTPSSATDTAVWEGSSNWTSGAGFTCGRMVARPSAYTGNMDFGAYTYTAAECSLSTGGTITATGLFTITGDVSVVLTCTGTLTATELNVDCQGTGSFTAKSTVDSLYCAYVGKTTTLLGNAKYLYPQSATGTLTIGTTFIASPDKNYTWNQNGCTFNGSGYWTLQTLGGIKMALGKLNYVGSAGVINIRNSHFSGTDTIQTTDSLKIAATASASTFGFYKQSGFKHRFIVGAPLVIGRNYTTLFGNNNATDTNFMDMGSSNHFFGAGLNDSTYNAGLTLITTSGTPTWTVHGNMVFGSNTRFTSSGYKILVDTAGRFRTAGITLDTIVFNAGSGFVDSLCDSGNIAKLYVQSGKVKGLSYGGTIRDSLILAGADSLFGRLTGGKYWSFPNRSTVKITNTSSARLLDSTKYSFDVGGTWNQDSANTVNRIVLSSSAGNGKIVFPQNKKLTILNGVAGDFSGTAGNPDSLVAITACTLSTTLKETNLYLENIIGNGNDTCLESGGCVDGGGNSGVYFGAAEVPFSIDSLHKRGTTDTVAYRLDVMRIYWTLPGARTIEEFLIDGNAVTVVESDNDSADFIVPAGTGVGLVEVIVGDSVSPSEINYDTAYFTCLGDQVVDTTGITFLAIGQSNMSGSSGTGSLSSVNFDSAKVWNGSAWVAYTDVGRPGGTIWPAALNHLHTIYPGATLRVINQAVGATGFVTTWTDSNSATYQNMLTEVEQANQEIDGIWIIGGEQDMAEGQTENAIALADDTLIINLRKHVSETCPIIFALPHRDNYSATNCRNAILSRIDTSAGIYLACDIYALYHSDDVHRSTRDLDKVGKSMALTWAQSQGYDYPEPTYLAGASYHQIIQIDKTLIGDTVANYPWTFDLSRLGDTAWSMIRTGDNIAVINQYTGSQCAKYAVVDTANDSGYIVWDAPVSYTYGGRFSIEIGSGVSVANSATAATNSGYTMLSVDGITDIAGGYTGTLEGSATSVTATVGKGVNSTATSGSVTHTDPIVGTGAIMGEVIYKPSGASENANQYLLSNGRFIMVRNDAGSTNYVGATRNTTIKWSNDGAATVGQWNSFMVTSSAAGVCTLFTNKNRLTNGAGGTPATGTHNMVFNNSSTDDRTFNGIGQRYGIIGEIKTNPLAWTVNVHNNFIDQANFAELGDDSLSETTPVIDSIRWKNHPALLRDSTVKQAARPLDTIYCYGTFTLGDSLKLRLNSTGSVTATIIATQAGRITATVPAGVSGWMSSWVRGGDMAIGTPLRHAILIKRPGGL